MFQDALISEVVHPSIPLSDRIFEPFIGEWDLRVRWYVEGNLAREMAGEWSFSRVLEGRGIQDVWIVPPRGQRNAEELYEYGTSVRFYEPSLQAWRSTWIGPMHGMVQTFLAQRDGDNIVLATKPQTEGALRWVFSDITAQEFHWHNYVYRRGVWQLQQDFLCTRKG